MDAPTAEPSLPTLLIVEDEKSNLVSLERIFQREGFRTLLAEDARIGLEMCRKHRVHVVLTDLMMPGMNGLQFAAAVQAIRPGLPVVVLSAFSEGCQAEDIRRSGIREFIVKPAGLIPIAEAVRRALNSPIP